MGQDPGVITSTKVSEGLGSQLSVTVGVVQLGVSSQLIVVGPGRVEITGGAISTTLIVCVAVEELPQVSVAVQVLVIEY